MNKNILIASSTISSDEYLPVVSKLVDRGCDVAVYNSDRVISGQDSFSVRVTGNDVRIDYEGKGISNDSVDAIWYRKVADFQHPGQTDDKAKTLLIQDEVANFHQDIWSLYDSDKWLNAPENILKASNKLGQLVVASQVGLNTPQTIVSSNWNEITNKLMNNDAYEKIIVKMVRGVIIQDNQEMAMPTTVLPRERVDFLSETTTSFPGIYQPFLRKSREWRITVVGENIYPVAIYTDDRAKDDWRRHQNSNSVQFKPEPFDAGTAEKCIEFLKRYKLKFGAFDFIEDDSGEMTFLECNANGQYYRFEELFDMPISDAIVDELINIATG